MRRPTNPPYQRIAEALRAKIESGDLRIGDRVPSTRELAREWKVAMATAAHALKALAEEGLVRGVSRVGTVVAGPRARVTPRARDTELTRARIVDAAIAIADAEGLAALSLRGVAAKLSAPVMSLYRHVASKEELVLAMTNQSLGEETLPSVVPRGWRAQLEVAARAHWSVVRKHPWLGRALTMSRPNPLPNALVYAEWVLRALGGLGLSASERMQLHIILHGFIQGIAVNLESEAEAASETGMTDDEHMSTQLAAFGALAASGKYPSFAVLLGELRESFDLDFQQLFEIGLASLLDGFDAYIARRKTAATRS
ncbi:GntR family transcriptional regulator [soil metagenome]